MRDLRLLAVELAPYGGVTVAAAAHESSAGTAEAAGAVFTPTKPSWLNLIETHFGAMKRFAPANTDDPSHAIRRRRVYRYLRYRHRQAESLRLAGIRGVGLDTLESRRAGSAGMPRTFGSNIRKSICIAA